MLRTCSQKLVAQSLLILIWLIPTILLVQHTCADEKQLPNLILIMADDLGYGDLSCYDGWINTPHLDKLAQSGMRFTDYHSNGAVCSPTRAALLTGRYQQRAGIPGVVYAAENRPEHEHGLQPIENTFAELLAGQGYATGIFGKWHLGYHVPYNPVNHGFDQFRGYVSGNIDFFSHVDQAGNYDWWHDTKLVEEPGYVTHLITKHAVKFIEQNHERPFCLYLPHEAPHYPYQGPDDQAVRKVGQPRSASELKLSEQQKRKAYRQMVEAMDQSTGEVMATLAKHDLLENTLVIFCSDNGATRLGSNGKLRGRKGQMWEGGHRVPAMISWPGRIAAGSETDATCLSMDLMPTMLELAGIDSPADRPLDGRSLLPLLLEKNDSTQETLSTRTLFWNGQVARRGKWKLVLTGKNNNSKTELFNLEEDLGETTNLASENQALVADLKRALEQWKQDMSATATKQP